MKVTYSHLLNDSDKVSVIVIIVWLGLVESACSHYELLYGVTDSNVLVWIVAYI